MLSDCLDENLLGQLVEGSLPPESRERVEAHLDECPACRRLTAMALPDLDGSTADLAEDTTDTVAPTSLPAPGSASSGSSSPSYASANLAALSAGKGLLRYELRERLGDGASGVVYAAYDPRLAREVALKLLRDESPEAAERLRREARLQSLVDHPNVCKIHEVSERGERPFIAMQLVAGETLAKAAPAMALEDKVRLLRDVALGVHAAHEAGCVHRDLKPSNILVEREADGALKPYVTDFGLVHEVAARRDEEPRAASELRSTRSPDDPDGDVGAARGGGVFGTPSYMAPEQVAGPAAGVDRRADVYALGAILYELCCGEPPFAGRGAAAVFVQRARAEPVTLRRKNPRTPRDLDTVAMRCLRHAPGERYPTARALAEELDRYLDGRPVLARRRGPLERAWRFVRRHRAAALTVGLGVLLATITGVTSLAGARAERREHVARGLAEGDVARNDAVGRAAELRELRKRALALFHEGRDAEADAAWARAATARDATDLAYARAERSLQAALVWDPRRPDVRGALAQLLYEWAAFTEEHEVGGQHAGERRGDLLARMALFDDDGARARAFAALPVLHVATEPAGASVEASRYEPDARGRLAEGPPRALGRAPLTVRELRAGSYLFVLRAPGREDVRYPLLLRAREERRVRIELPRAGTTPEGFAYVPAGRFYAGSEAESLRPLTESLPLHEGETGAYLVARHETTVAQYLEFLGSLSPAERARRRPRSRHAAGGQVEAAELAGGGWEYRVEMTDGRRMSARAGAMLVHPGRTRRAAQDWRRFPVSGISMDDALAFASWSARVGRVPGARLCTQAELERAARGADTRPYPRGATLDPDDANLIETYTLAGIGLDEVGSHPGGRSPFGVDDTVGNATELVARAPGQSRACSAGSEVWAELASAGIGRVSCAPRGFRSPSTGMRLCATPGVRR